MIDKWVNDIHEGDAKEVLREMPESSVHMAMTSPPYYGLRDYGDETITVWGGDDDCEHVWDDRDVYQDSPVRRGSPDQHDTTAKDERWRTTGRCKQCGARREQLGLEEQLDDYIQDLVEVGAEIRRVLRDDGSWWLNLGDSYSGSGGSGGQWDEDVDAGTAAYAGERGNSYNGPLNTQSFGKKNKLLIPHRVAAALQSDGWIIRSDAVWAKPNPMPDPAKDRFREDKEFIFHLTPNPDYWFDLDAIREPHKNRSIKRAQRKDNRHQHSRRQSVASEETLNPEQFVHPNGKNPGDILEVTVQPFPEAHFAVYPPELVETPMKATCPPKVCAECGSPYVRESVQTGLLTNPTGRTQKDRAIEIFEESNLDRSHLSALRSVGFTDAGQAQEVYDGYGNNRDEVEERAEEAKDVLGGYAREFLGSDTTSSEWVQGCDCDTDETEPGIALDPFAGAGTTALEAKRLGRRFIGIDLNPEYVAMAQKRVGIDVDRPELLLEEHEQSLRAFANGGQE